MPQKGRMFFFKTPLLPNLAGIIPKTLLMVRPTCKRGLNVHPKKMPSPLLEAVPLLDIQRERTLRWQGPHQESPPRGALRKPCLTRMEQNILSAPALGGRQFSR